MLESGHVLAHRILVVGMEKLTFEWAVGVSFVQGDYWAQVVGTVGLWWRKVCLLRTEVFGKSLFGFSPSDSMVVSRKPPVVHLPSGLAVVSGKPPVVCLSFGLAVVSGKPSVVCLPSGLAVEVVTKSV
ncbi:unnamed protein product [Lactuca virosa]|uniref:Uncharacterized protein n=1 Tax=Lactuca virosa TaxID=75947 RepID=A0AAU9MDR0_9ASTR|nr:unnamed protein product [Lactuca virosa]